MSCRNSFFVCVLLLSLACLINEVYADSFWIDCGSPHNTTFGDRTFMGDSYASKYLVTPVSILANTTTSTNLKMYQTARIFNGTTRYKFPINHMGRYVVRLYFFPFSYNSYNLSTAKFLVSSQQFMLLSDYTPTSETMKEYSFKVFGKYLEIIIEPAVNFVAFLNALEVFLVPSVLIKDDATLIKPRKAYKGLQIVALETIFRVNMGGRTVGSNNDTLWRTWKSDVSYLENSNFAAKAQSSTAIQYRSGRATRDVAPITIYGTCRRLNTQNYPNTDFNVTWSFEVDIGFQYLIRFHYCDIVSESPNELYFNVFVDSWIVSRVLDLTTLSDGFLRTPIYVDFVTPKITRNKLNVSIGPPVAHVNNPDAILNGLEIMKISDSKNTLDKGPSLPSSKEGSKSKIGVIARVIVVAVVSLLVLVVIVVFFYMNRDMLNQG